MQIYYVYKVRYLFKCMIKGKRYVLDITSLPKAERVFTIQNVYFLARSEASSNIYRCCQCFDCYRYHIVALHHYAIFVF